MWLVVRGRSTSLAVIKGKLHSKIISSDIRSIDFFRRIRWWRSEVEVRTGRRSNRRRKKLARASICDVMAPHWCHLAIMARSRDWIKIFVISRNQPVSSDDADTTMTAIVISLIIVTQSSHDASNLDPMSQEIFATFWYLSASCRQVSIVDCSNGVFSSRPWQKKRALKFALKGCESFKACFELYRCLNPKKSFKSSLKKDFWAFCMISEAQYFEL